MSNDLGSMQVSFTADTSNLEQGVNRAKGAVGGLSSVGSGLMGGIGGALLDVGKAAIGFGVVSIKSGADFQESMSKVGAYVGLTKSQTDDLGNSIMSLATSMGQSPKAMADALYPIMSTGYSAAQSLDILKLSAETAAASGADMSVIANTLTSSLKAFAAPASDAGKYMDDINQMVALGKGQVSDYAAVLGKLSLSARSANVPFGDMGAALADLTKHGFPTVAQASTALGNLFNQVGTKVDTLAGHAKKLGLTFDENKFKTDSLTQKLADLQKATGGNQGEILKLLGGSGLALKAFNAMEGSTGDLTADMKKMGNATGTTAQVFQKTHDDWNNSVKRLSATYEVIKDKVGLFLIGALTPLLNMITPIIGAFSDWMSASNGLGGVFSTLNQIFQPLVLTIQSFDWTGFTYGFKQIGAAISGIFSPVSSLGGAFKGLDIKGIGQAIQLGFLFVMNKIPGVLTFVAGGIKALKPIIDEVGGIIGGVFAGHMRMATGVAQGLGKWFSSSLMPAIKQAMPGFQSLASTIMTTLVPGLFKLWAIGQSVVDKVMPPLVAAFEAALPPIIRIAGIIAGGLSMAIKFLMPYTVQAGKALADFAGQIADRVLPIVVQFWNKISVGLDWLQASWKYIWPSLSLILKGVWDVISGIVQVAWSLVSGIIKIGLDILSGNWGQAWADMRDMLGGVWNGIKSILKGAIEEIAGIFTGLGQMAISWGQGLISGFVQGIKNSLGQVGSVMSSVVNTIGSFLPHSPAKQGELSHLNDYGPSLMKGISTGIIGAKPTLEAAMNVAVSPFAMLNTQHYLQSSAGGSAGSGSGASGPVEIYVMLDSKQIGHATAPHIVQRMRVLTQMRN